MEWNMKTPPPLQWEWDNNLMIFNGKLSEIPKQVQPTHWGVEGDGGGFHVQNQGFNAQTQRFSIPSQDFSTKNQVISSISLPMVTPPQNTSYSFQNISNMVPIKLTRENYQMWRSFFIPILNTYDLHGLIEGTDPCPPKFTTADNGTSVVNPAYISWMKRDQMLLIWINATLSGDLLPYVVGLPTSRQLWLTLEKRCSKSSILASGGEDSGTSPTTLGLRLSLVNIGLKLGKRTNFEDVCAGSVVKPSSFAPTPTSSTSATKRSRASYDSTQTRRCQVEGCNIDLSSSRDYYRRHRVCESHSKCPRVVVAGLESRFCQQCSRFHDMMEFDENKRSCRRRLSLYARHRKSQPEGIQFNSDRLSSSFYVKLRVKEESLKTMEEKFENMHMTSS